MSEHGGPEGLASATIYAEATAFGTAGIAVVRVSGPCARIVMDRLTGQTKIKARHATRVNIYRSHDGELLDSALALWFPKPNSFTGEDIAEFHLHGGRAVVAAVLAELEAISGLRMAEPGEFSRRAFMNDKMDLTEAEGLADLIAAETEMQRKQALRQLNGGLGDRYEDWRHRLLRDLAHTEAVLDFADEELPVGLLDHLNQDVKLLVQEITAHLDDDRRGERLREGVRVAIVGPPNVGKSSLFNHLAKRDVVIVHDRAGTTRDVVEIQLDLGGFPVFISDTAGIRESSDEVESEGIRRAKAVAEESDLVVGVCDASVVPALDPETLSLLGESGLLVMNKIDLLGDQLPEMIGGYRLQHVSCRTGAGLDGLTETLTTKVHRMMSSVVSGSLISRQRHRESLIECRNALVRFGGAQAVELSAEELRHAVHSLGRITGRVDVEDILGLIFREFCIGK